MAYDELNGIIEYEEGTLDKEQTIELFQHLVNNGLAWSLQGHYGRMATNLIRKGLITTPEQRKARVQKEKERTQSV